MGMSPAPTIANLFVAIYEAKKIIPLIGTYLFLLHWFINNGFGIWIYDPDPAIDAMNWQTIQVIVNTMGLFWDFTKLSQKVVFMDLKIEILDRRFVCSLYANYTTGKGIGVVHCGI
jgi:hypothetical protein